MYGKVYMYNVHIEPGEYVWWRAKEKQETALKTRDSHN